MKIGTMIGLGYDSGRPEFLDVLGPALEARGFESVWIPEHVVLFDEHDSTNPYSAEQAMIPGDLGLLDPFLALTYLGARTTTLRLGTGICLVGQRNPVYTAKQVADLDVLSGGRFEFGIGLGWLEEEYRAVGVPWAARGARVDEYLQVMTKLWTDSVSSHHGRVYDLPACRMYPKPAQRPHPAIHVGGESDAALRRVARHGQGWFSMFRPVEELSAALDRLDTALAREGRSRSDITLNVSPPPGPIDADAVVRYAEAGVDRLIITVVAMSRDSLLHELDGLAQHTNAARAEGAAG